MLYFFDPIYEAVKILAESEKPNRREELEIQAILEDTSSQVSTKYIEALYNSVIEKGHVDFGNIPVSKGNIVEYNGYTNLIETLANMMTLANEHKASQAIEYTKIVQDSIGYMRKLAPIYQKGFRVKNDYLMLEYNTFVYTIIQATSTLLYEFVDYVKNPSRPTIEITLKSTKYRANTYYIEQLGKFNKINERMQYSKYLESILLKGKEAFTGAAALGLATVVSVGLAIIPITRSLVYGYYSTKSNLSDCLALQAYFLEMNKAVVEANSEFNQKKKDSILIKQEKIKNMCLRLSEKLRVEHVKSVDATKAMIQNENKLLTIDTIKKEVSDSPLQLL